LSSPTNRFQRWVICPPFALPPLPISFLCPLRPFPQPFAHPSHPPASLSSFRERAGVNLHQAVLQQTSKDSNIRLWIYSPTAGHNNLVLTLPFGSCARNETFALKIQYKNEDLISMCGFSQEVILAHYILRDAFPANVSNFSTPRSPEKRQRTSSLSSLLPRWRRRGTEQPT